MQSMVIKNIFAPIRLLRVARSGRSLVALTPLQSRTAVTFMSDVNNSQNAIDKMDVESIMAKISQDVDISLLSEDEVTIHQCHLKAIQNKQPTYKDPVTGFEVFSVLHHLERGDCCGNACRHCPYEHKNVEKKYRATRRHNTAFWS